jgi:hypothetical protein
MSRPGCIYDLHPQEAEFPLLQAVLTCIGAPHEKYAGGGSLLVGTV